MAWVELQVPGLPQEVVQSLSQRLFELGAAGIQEDYLPGEAPAPQQPWDTEPPEAPPALRLLRAWFEDPDPPRIAALTGDLVDTSCFRWETVPEEDWEESWKEGFEPIKISDDLVITPPWHPIPGALVIEPGQAFGTGAHPSTLAILRWIDRLRLEGTVLDVGCGSGILALAAARLGCDVIGVDIDADSVREAKRNAQINGLSARFSTAPLRHCEPADTVLCNLYAEAIAANMDELVRCTKQRLVLAGLLTARVDQVFDALAYRLDVEHREDEGEWTCLLLRRRA